MSKTPSARRREGSEAYCRGGKPNELNPYKNQPCESIDWREGWDRAQIIDEIRQDEEREIERRRMAPISWAIDDAETDDDVKEILRRIAEHVGME